MTNFDEWLQTEPWQTKPNELIGDMESYDQYSDDKLTGDEPHGY
jgi:hypothetical protein